MLGTPGSLRFRLRTEACLSSLRLQAAAHKLSQAMNYLKVGALAIHDNQGHVASINALVETFQMDLNLLELVHNEIRNLRRLTFKNLACTCKAYYETWTDNQEVEVIFECLYNALNS